MLRLQRRVAEDTEETRSPRRTAVTRYSMHADPLELPSHPPIEVRHPDAPNVIVRVGPTLTHVMGFGPSGEVASWLADALVTPSYIVTSDAIDEARLAFEAQGHSQISASSATSRSRSRGSLAGKDV